MNILIVEDNRATANLLKSFVEAEQDFRDVGVLVYTAHDMDTAVNKTHVRQISLVILDFALPDSKAEDTLERIHEFGCHVIGYSGVADAEMTMAAIKKGCVDVIIKGTPKEVQLMQIGRVLARANGGKAARAIHTQSTRLKEREEAKATWFGSSTSVITLSILVITQLIALSGFIWNQSASNALFRKQVADNSGDINVMKVQQSTLHDQNQTSISDRQQINRRIDDFDKDFKAMRAEMNAGFSKTYELFLQQKGKQ